MSTQGASVRDWNHFRFVLGLGADLLPVVPDKNAIPSPLSKVKQFGKIPSCFNSRGEAHGIAKWQEREITEDEVEHWSEDRRLSVCVRAKAVRAIDVDITDPEIARRVWNVLDTISPHSLVRRTRANSSKFLCPILLSGEYSKRIIDCGAAGRIEFLADGQQWLVAGGHESGSMYEWVGGLPESIPRLEPEDFESIWSILEERFATIKGGDNYARNPLPKSRYDGPGAAHPVDNTLLFEISDAEEADLMSALEYPPLLSATVDNDFWSEIGYALLSLGGHGAFIFGEFSVRAPGYTPNSHVDWWSAHEGQTPRSDFRHIFTLARRLGWRSSADPADFPIVEPKDDTAPLIELEPTVHDLAGAAPEHLYPTTDLSNARRLHDRFAGNQVIFGRGCFHEWNGIYWQRNENAGKRCALQLALIVKAEAEELRPKVEALIEAATPEDLADFEALREKRRADRLGSALFKKIGNTELWRTYATMENLEVWAQKCEGDPTQAAAARMLKTVMEVL